MKNPFGDNFDLSDLSDNFVFSIGGGNPPPQPQPGPQLVEASAEAQEAEAAVASSGPGGPGSTVAVTASSGFTINLEFDAAAMAAPAGFRTGIEQAAALLSAAITDPITVNISIDYSGTGGGAAGGPTGGYYEPYSTVRTDLINNASPGDDTFSSLPTGSSIAGQTSVAVWYGQLKAMGLISATGSELDGSATFATDINSNLLVGVALHELTHAMGRVPYGPSSSQPTITQPDIFDFYRFTSAGNILIDGNATAPPAYFSLNGGVTKLADYGQTSDSSDFLNSGVQGSTDPFDEFYSSSTQQQLTAMDLKQLDALGFHLATNAQPTTVIAASDFNGDGTSDLLWRNSSTGEVDTWLMSNGQMNGGTGVGFVSSAWQFAGSGHFNSDSTSDLLWRNTTTGEVDTWLMSDGLISGGAAVGQVSSAWQILGTGDFNGDTASDILWLNTNTGEVDTWFMSNGLANGGTAVGTVSSAWQFAGIGDFNADSTADVLWRNSNTGEVDIWLLNKGHINGGSAIGTVSSAWQPIGIADFNGDGTSDVLWRNTTTGEVDDWLLKNGQYFGGAALGNVSSAWQVKAIGNFNGDGTNDIVWQNSTTGEVDLWIVKNGQYAGGHSLGVVPTTWQIQPITSGPTDPIGTVSGTSPALESPETYTSATMQTPSAAPAAPTLAGGAFAFRPDLGTGASPNGGWANPPLQAGQLIMSLAEHIGVEQQAVFAEIHDLVGNHDSLLSHMFDALHGFIIH